jgi:hypothetical protein
LNSQLLRKEITSSDTDIDFFDYIFWIFTNSHINNVYSNNISSAVEYLEKLIECLYKEIEIRIINNKRYQYN